MIGTSRKPSPDKAGRKPNEKRRGPRRVQCIVPEGFLPDAYVVKKLQKIRPDLTESQAMEIIATEIRKPENVEWFAGSYSETNSGRLVIPIRAANLLAERLAAAEEQRRELTRQGQLSFEQMDSIFRREIVLQRLHKLLQTKKNGVSAALLAKCLGVSERIIYTLLKNNQLKVGLGGKITTKSIRELFG